MADLFTADESGGHVAAELKLCRAGEVRGGSAGNNFVTGFRYSWINLNVVKLTDENRQDDYAERNSSTSQRHDKFSFAVPLSVSSKGVLVLQISALTGRQSCLFDRNPHWFSHWGFWHYAIIAVIIQKFLVVVKAKRRF